MNLFIGFQNIPINQLDNPSIIQFPQPLPQQSFLKCEDQKNQNSTSEDDSLHKLNNQVTERMKEQKQTQKKMIQIVSEYNSCKEKETQYLQQSKQPENQNFKIKKNNYFNPFKFYGNSLKKNQLEMIEQSFITKKQLKINKIKQKQNNIQNIQNSQKDSQQQNVLVFNTSQLKNNLLQHQNLNINILNCQENQNVKMLKKIINHKNLSVKELPPYSETLQKNIKKMNITESPSTDFNQLQNQRKCVNRLINNLAYVAVDNQMFSSSNQNSTSSLWQKPNKIQQKIEVSFYSQDQQTILLQLSDYFKFIISAFDLSKSIYYRSCRLFRKIYYLINNKETTTYQFAAACITIYTKLQCQKLFNDNSKQFPNINTLNQNLKEQIQKRYPIIPFKRIRVAESAILKVINFNLELEDNTVQLIDDICHKWTQYVCANQNKINYPKLCMQVGCQNRDQRRNLLNVIFLMDNLQFFPSIVFYPNTNEQKKSIECKDNQYFNCDLHKCVLLNIWVIQKPQILKNIIHLDKVYKKSFENVRIRYRLVEIDYLEIQIVFYGRTFESCVFRHYLKIIKKNYQKAR